LHSILSHAKGTGISHVLLLAADEVFSHEDILRTAADEGIRLTTVRSIEGAIDTLDQTLSEARRQLLETRAARLRSFLLTQQSRIVSRIRGAVEIDPYYFGFSKIVEIKALELADVESALPGYLPTGTVEGRLKVYFVAKLRVAIVAEPAPELPGPPTVRLEEGIVREDILRAFGRFLPREPVEKVITPSVGVEASVNHSMSTGEYSDLEVEAIVQPTVISEMLRRDQETK
jgi:hypothetical protein